MKITYQIKPSNRSDRAHEIVIDREDHTGFARVNVLEDDLTKQTIESVKLADFLKDCLEQYYEGKG